MDKVKSTEAAMAASAVVGTVALVQMLTDWDPLGRCFTFVKQLRGHVRVVSSLCFVRFTLSLVSGRRYMLEWL